MGRAVGRAGGQVDRQTDRQTDIQRGILASGHPIFHIMCYYIITMSKKFAWDLFSEFRNHLKLPKLKTCEHEKSAFTPPSKTKYGYNSVSVSDCLIPGSALCSPVPMLPSTYVPRVPIFPSTYVPRYGVRLRGRISCNVILHISVSWSHAQSHK